MKLTEDQCTAIKDIVEAVNFQIAGMIGKAALDSELNRAFNLLGLERAFQAATDGAGAVFAEFLASRVGNAEDLLENEGYEMIMKMAEAGCRSIERRIQN